jgi:Sulfotransferase family
MTDGEALAVKAPRRPLWRRPMYRALWKVQRNVWGRAFLDLGGDHRSAVYVAGSGRSGTTWLAEVINYRNAYRYMFEPLTPPHVPEFQHLIRGQYLRPENHDPAYLTPMASVLNGRLRHRWVDYYNRRPVATRRLVKDVYANLMLKWIQVNFPGMPIVFVLRHPCAVLTSRLSLAPSDLHQRFEPDLERFLAQDELMADFIAPFEGAMRDASTPLERQAFWWCVENYVPLRMCAGGEIHAVCYERLRNDPAEEIPLMGTFIGRTFDPVVFTRMQRRSLTTGPHSALQVDGEPITNWTRRWSDEDVKRVVRILSLFGLDEIYTDSPMPRVQGIAALQERWCASSRPS